MMSVSGVAFLLEDHLDRLFVPSTVQADGREPMSDDEMEARIEEVYADFEIVMISPPFNPQRAAAVVVRQDDVSTIRYFDPYTGEDRGSANPWQTNIYRWLIDFHDDLLIPGMGRDINGWGALVFLVMMLSGFTIWWRGKQQWRQSFTISSKSPRATLWQLHSVFGFWTLFFMLAWGLSGMFLTIPEVLRVVTEPLGLSNLLGMGIVGISPVEIDAMLEAGPLADNYQLLNINDFRADRSSGFMDFMVDIHFGRYESGWIIALLTVIGLVPAMMFITGFILWWQRVVMRSYRKLMSRN